MSTISAGHDPSGQHAGELFSALQQPGGQHDEDVVSDMILAIVLLACTLSLAFVWRSYARQRPSV